jgi:hypothetical protein
LETQDFVIVSDANPKDIAEFAVGYSAFRHAFRQLFVPSGRLPRAQVILFRREQPFDEAQQFLDTYPKSQDVRSPIQTELQNASLF